MSVPDLEKLLLEVARKQRSSYYGKYRGIVISPDDPDGQGKITVKVPNLLQDTEIIARPCLPFAGKNHGIVFLPEADDGVWIEFESGNLSYPIWSGSWFAEDEMTPEMVPDCNCLITSKGMQVLLDDKNDKMVLKHGGGASITLDSHGITLAVGATKLEITASGFVVNSGAFEVSS